MTSGAPREYAWCPELVTDDYGHEVPCGQPAEVVDRVTDHGTSPVVRVVLRCLSLRHPSTPVEGTVCYMP